MLSGAIPHARASAILSPYRHCRNGWRRLAPRYRAAGLPGPYGGPAFTPADHLSQPALGPALGTDHARPGAGRRRGSGPLRWPASRGGRTWRSWATSTASVRRPHVGWPPLTPCAAGAPAPAPASSPLDGDVAPGAGRASTGSSRISPSYFVCWPACLMGARQERGSLPGAPGSRSAVLDHARGGRLVSAHGFDLSPTRLPGGSG